MNEMSSSEPPQNEFWCHQCRARMRPLPGPKCPTCQGDFVEEIQPGSDNPEDYYIQEDPVAPNVQPADPLQNILTAFQNLQNEIIARQQQHQARIAQLQGQQGQVATQAGQPAQVAPQPNVPRQPVPFNPNAVPFGGNAQPGLFPPGFHGIQIQIQDGRGGPARVMQLPIHDLFGALGLGPLHGNLADYGFGRSMQDIITQIMNQTQHQGPPPASKEFVAKLPKVKVTKEEVDKKAQCAVCMVDLEEDEEVTKLPCDHPFHDGCIKPWLEIHNSCPVCRFEMPTDDPDYESRRQMRTSQGSNGQGRPSPSSSDNSSPSQGSNGSA